MTNILTGIVLILLGFLHFISASDESERKILVRLQTLFNRRPWLGFFQEIWFLGRTVFVFIITAMLIVFDWKMGLTANLILVIIFAFEMLVKIAIKRPRPFSADQHILMLQPKEPTDTSFPSGDTMRVWYLAVIIPIIAGGSPSLMIVSASLALFVSLGRLVMGVHYPTDVLAGAGLGILGGGATVWLWQLLSLI